MPTTSRLLSLLSLLQTRRDWPGVVLAERLDISHRTVRRDVDRLREMGYRITATMGPDGGYRLEAGDELPPLLFDDDQVIAMAVALKSAAVSGSGTEEGALRALSTVRQVMPSRLRHRLDAVEFTSITSRPGDGTRAVVSPEVLLELSTAARGSQVVRFDYTAGSAARAADSPVASPVRKAEPHHLVASNGRWYLVGWDLDKKDWRIFRVDKMTLRGPHGPRFPTRPLPADSVAEFVSARFKGSENGNRWPCIGSAVLSLPLSAVLPFAGDATVEALDADRCRIDAGSWSWTALAASLLRFDADIEVLGPPELTEAFGTLAARTAASAGLRLPR